MPKVLIYRSELLPRSETFIRAQAEALVRYTPVFACVRRVRNTLSLGDFAALTAERFPGERRLARWLRPDAGAEVLAPALLRAAAAQTPALVHAHFALDAAEALPLAETLRVPLLVTLHGYDVVCTDAAHRETPAGRLYLARREELWARTAKFLCVSNAILEQARARGFPPEKLQVLPIGIDTRAFTVAHRLMREPLILFVGRLVEKKGTRVLLQAMEQVLQRLPQARLVIAGDGPERQMLEHMASRLAPGTRFVGMQSPQQVRTWMRRARCLAAPSLTAANGDSEGLPTVLCEAMAMGLPVASTRHSGIPELIGHRFHGLLAPEGDAVMLARHLVELCTNDTLAESLRSAARARVEQFFDLRIQTAALESIYDEVAAGTAHLFAARCANRTWTRLPEAFAENGSVTSDGVAWSAAEEPQTTGGPARNAARHLNGNVRRFGPRASGNKQPEPAPGVSPGSVSQPNHVSSAVPSAVAAAAPRLRYQAAWLLSGNGAAILFQALYFLLMGRLLGSREYGAFVGMVALVNVLAQFSSVGMEMVLLRTISRDRAAFAQSWSRALTVSSGGFLALLFAVLVYGHFYLAPSLCQLLPYLAFSDALFGKLTQLSSRALQGADMARWSAKLLALANGARAGAAGLLFLWALRTHAHVALLAWARLYAAASLLVAVASLALVTRLLGRPRWASVRRQHLAEGLSFSFSSSSISVYNDIDKTLLVSHGLLAEAGIYAAAYRIVDVVSTPITSLFSAASPRLFRRGASQGALGAARGARPLLLCSAAFGVLAAPALVWVAPALPHLFGRSFAGSSAALRFLCLLPLLRGLHYAWGTAITACTSQWLRTAAQASAAGLNIALNLWLIPRFGWRGGAAATLLTDGALALMSLGILQALVRRQVQRTGEKKVSVSDRPVAFVAAAVTETNPGSLSSVASAADDRVLLGPTLSQDPSWPEQPASRGTPLPPQASLSSAVDGNL